MKLFRFVVFFEKAYQMQKQKWHKHTYTYILCGMHDGSDHGILMLQAITNIRFVSTEGGRTSS